MRKYPILRLAIPLATGVFFAECFHGLFPLEGVLVALAVLLAVLGAGLLVRSFRCRWMFGAGVMLFLFLTGVALMDNQWRRVDRDWPPGRQVYKGVVQEAPVEKKRSTQYKVEINGRDVLLYLAKDAMSHSVDVGDSLLIHARIRQPVNRNDSSRFDYVRYLKLHQVGGVAYVPSGSWKKLDRTPRLTWKQKALKVREKMMDEYRKWGLTGEQVAVLSALTIGYKAELDEDLREKYAVAGISHVLALSGLHIGIVWMLLGFLLKPLERSRWGRWLKWGVSTLMLWCFAFVAGLEASVVRAVIMCMLMELGRVSGGRALSLNTLGIAGFCMLLYNPFYLFDAGFQLSFVAVLSILMFYPLVNRMVPSEHRILRWGWGIVSVSVSAQWGTAPLVMYYFSNFSVYFLLANIVVSILVPMIIAVGFLALLLAPMGGIHAWIVGVLGGLIDGINLTATEISSWPWASFSLSEVTPVEVGACYLLLGGIWRCWAHPSWKAWMGVLAGVVVFLTVRLCVLMGG